MRKPGQILVYNHQNRPFVVKLIRKGERYGLNDCYVNEADDPLVEFYDASQDPEKFGVNGQLASRYYLSTLRQHRGSPGDRYVGLTLHGGVPEWVIDPMSMVQIYRWLDSVQP